MSDILTLAGDHLDGMEKLQRAEWPQLSNS